MKIDRQENHIVIDTHNDNLAVALTPEKALDVAQALLKYAIDIRNNPIEQGQNLSEVRGLIETTQIDLT